MHWRTTTTSTDESLSVVSAVRYLPWGAAPGTLGRPAEVGAQRRDNQIPEASVDPAAHDRAIARFRFSRNSLGPVNSIPRLGWSIHESHQDEDLPTVDRQRRPQHQIPSAQAFRRPAISASIHDWSSFCREDCTLAR